MPTSFSDIIVFGESSSDTGNLFAATGGAVAGAPYYWGRFSDGPVWVEVLAEELGLPVPTPSLLGGTNYAWAGAETGGGLSSFFETPNVGQQIDFFLGAGGTLASDDLLVVWGGANDIIAWEAPSSPAQIVQNFSHHLTSLAAAGGQTFVVPNLPALGQAPLFRGTPDEVRIDTLAVQVNKLLDRELEGLEAALGITIVRLDVAGLADGMLHDPQEFGLTNVTDPACPGCGIGFPSPDAGDTMVPNPDDYLWWDFIHPTRGVHRTIGELAAEAVQGGTGTLAVTSSTFLTSAPAAAALSDASSLPVRYATAPGAAVPGVVQVNGDKVKEEDDEFFDNLGDPIHAVLADAQGLGTNRADGDRQLFGCGWL
ncbi:MAG: SGNH/GDSL hydrolase family protein [Gemmataceae bacterium]|nr:SGNH/GDSL hydrolase family protein [Gemmataceae bacterium]